MSAIINEEEGKDWGTLTPCCGMLEITSNTVASSSVKSNRFYVAGVNYQRDQGSSVSEASFDLLGTGSTGPPA